MATRRDQLFLKVIRQDYPPRLVLEGLKVPLGSLRGSMFPTTRFWKWHRPFKEKDKDRYISTDSIHLTGVPAKDDCPDIHHQAAGVQDQLQCSHRWPCSLADRKPELRRTVLYFGAHGNKYCLQGSTYS